VALSIDEDVDSDTLGLTLTGITVPSMMSTVTINVDSVDTNSLSSLEDTTIVLPKKAASFIASQAEDFTWLISEKSVNFQVSFVKPLIYLIMNSFSLSSWKRDRLQLKASDRVYFSSKLD
jgi:hypothetical protein